MSRVRVVAFVQVGASRIPVSAFRTIPTKASENVVELSDVVLMDRVRRGLTALCREIIGRSDVDGRSFD